MSLAVCFNARVVDENDLASRQRRLNPALNSVVADATKYEISGFRALKHTADMF